MKKIKSAVLWSMYGVGLVSALNAQDQTSPPRQPFPISLNRATHFPLPLEPGDLAHLPEVEEITPQEDIMDSEETLPLMRPLCPPCACAPQACAPQESTAEKTPPLSVQTADNQESSGF